MASIKLYFLFNIKESNQNNIINCIIDQHHTILFYLIIASIVVFWLLIYLIFYCSRRSEYCYFYYDPSYNYSFNTILCLFFSLGCLFYGQINLGYAEDYDNNLPFHHSFDYTHNTRYYNFCTKEYEFVNQLFSSQFLQYNKEYHDKLLIKFKYYYPQLYLCFLEAYINTNNINQVTPPIYSLSFIHNINPKMFCLNHFHKPGHPLLCGSLSDQSTRDFYIVQNKIHSCNFTDSISILDNNLHIDTFECKLKTVSKNPFSVKNLQSYTKYIQKENHYVILDVSNVQIDLQNKTYINLNKFLNMQPTYKTNFIINKTTYFEPKHFNKFNQNVIPFQIEKGFVKLLKKW